MFHYNYSLILLFLFKFCLTISINEQCFIRDTCTNSTSMSPSIYNDEYFIQSRNCFCDSVCEEYGDCCYYHSQSKKYECVDFLLPTISDEDIPSSRLFVWMRTECLSIYVGSKVDTQCRNLNNELFNANPILFIPVTSSQTNITYRNYYCAYCNNDADEKFIRSWEYKPFCYGEGTEKDNLILNTDQQVQYYISNLTKECDKTIRYPRPRLSSRPSVFIRPCKKITSTNMSSSNTCRFSSKLLVIRYSLSVCSKLKYYLSKFILCRM